MTFNGFCSTWKAVAFFFLVWFLLAGFLLSDGEESPGVRFAFAVCGSLGWFAATRGGWLRLYGKRFLRVINRYKTGIVSLILVGFLSSVFVQMWNVGYDKAHASSSSFALKQFGQALSGYARENGGHLPDRIGSEKMFLQLRPYFVSGIHDTPASPEEFPSRICPASGKPFIWRRSLSRLSVSTVKNPEKIIVAYSQTYKDIGDYRSVLFLNGYTKRYRFPGDFWKLWRDQPVLETSRSQGKTESHPVH